mmetsp:Transcript_5483/g.18552  ORF Transcript_5483/g.18552 Transcript_5483/m.18552 type:complete len:292 (-) Transcript_5483:168-1043(-)
MSPDGGRCGRGRGRRRRVRLRLERWTPTDCRTPSEPIDLSEALQPLDESGHLLHDPWPRSLLSRLLRELVHELHRGRPRGRLPQERKAARRRGVLAPHGERLRVHASQGAADDGLEHIRVRELPGHALHEIAPLEAHGACGEVHKLWVEQNHRDGDANPVVAVEQLEEGRGVEGRGGHHEHGARVLGHHAPRQAHRLDVRGQRPLAVDERCRALVREEDGERRRVALGGAAQVRCQQEREHLGDGQAVPQGRVRLVPGGGVEVHAQLGEAAPHATQDGGGALVGRVVKGVR